MKKLSPINEHIIVEAKVRKGYKVSKEAKIIPPSDYFVVHAGDSQFKAGQEVIFGGSARLTPIFREKGKFLVHSGAVVGFYA